MPGVPGVVEVAAPIHGLLEVTDVQCSVILMVTPTSAGLSRVVNTVERKNWTLLRVVFEAGDDHHTLRLTARKRRGDADLLVRHLAREVVVIHAEHVPSSAV